MDTDEPRETPPEPPPLTELPPSPPPPESKYVVNDLRNAQWLDEHNVNVEVDFSGTGAGHFLPFTAWDGDPTPHAQEIWRRVVVDGEAGAIAPAPPPREMPPPPVALAPLYRRMSDAELEALQIVLRVQPLRTRLLWQSSERLPRHEVQPLLVEVMGEERAAEVIG